MNDPYETSCIRRGLSVLLNESPVAPDFEELTAIDLQPIRPSTSRPIAAVVSAAALTAMFAVGGIWLAQAGGPSGLAAPPTNETTNPQPTADTTAPGSTTTTAGSVVGAPVDVQAVAEEFLADIPLPDSIDPAEITSSITASDLELVTAGAELPAGVTQTELDRYFIGAHVAGAAACAWIEVWLDSTAAGDQQRAAEGVSSLGTSRSWSVLTEMNPIGDFPEAVWEYADAVAGDGTVPAGYPGATVADTYKAALGCPTS